MTMEQWIVLVHAFATSAMTGLIWFVQVVHYPLFAAVGAREFVDYEAMHCRRTGWVVGPLMLIEAASAGWLFVAPPSAEVAWPAATGVVLLTVIWSSTAFIQVPCHRRLSAGLDLASMRRLVVSNWIRTIAWSARALLALYIVGRVFAAR